MSDGDDRRDVDVPDGQVDGRSRGPDHDPDGDRSGGSNADHPEAADREFDWRGWTLVAVVFVAFLVVPGLIYVYPHVPSAIRLSFRDTYLVLPMIPAIVLGLLAVWATTRP
jgi:hypothetical protein